MDGTGAPVEWHVLRGFGGSVASPSRVLAPRSEAELAEILRAAHDGGRSVCLRGRGRSYGDAALLRGDVVDVSRLPRDVHVDAAAGVAVASASATIEDLWRAALPRGWWPPVVPGTMHASLGGCVAMNVHGKNQFRSGAFGEHVLALDVLAADGTPRTIAPADPEFDAVVGGLGVLVVVVRVRLRLRRVHSGELLVQPRRVDDLGAAFDAMDELAPEADHLVGWIDAFPERAPGIVHAARHLSAREDPRPHRSLSLASQDLPERLLGVVPTSRAAMLARPFAAPLGVRVVNAVVAASRRCAATRRTSRDWRRSRSCSTT